MFKTIDMLYTAIDLFFSKLSILISIDKNLNVEPGKGFSKIYKQFFFISSGHVCFIFPWEI